MGSSKSLNSRSLSQQVLRTTVFGIFAALLALNVAADTDWNNSQASRPDDSDGGSSWRQPVPAGLLAWWKMDEGTGSRVFDASRHHNTGVIAGAPPPSWIVGISGSGLSFAGNGASFVAVAGSKNLGTITNAITLAAWVKPTVFNGVVITKWLLGSAAADGSYILNIPRGHMGLELFLDGTFSPFTGNTVFAGDNKWHHIAATYDGSQVFLYLDGNLDGTYTASGKIDVCDSSLFLGQLADGSFSYGGSMDNVRIYDRALSASEIQQLFLNKQ